MCTLTIKSSRNGSSSNSFTISPAYTLNCPPVQPPAGQTEWITTCTTAVPTGTKITIKGARESGMGYIVSVPLKTAAWSGCDAPKDDTCVVSPTSDRTIFASHS